MEQWYRQLTVLGQPFTKYLKIPFLVVHKTHSTKSLQSWIVTELEHYDYIIERQRQEKDAEELE